jgi:hypothetical protein
MGLRAVGSQSRARAIRSSNSARANHPQMILRRRSAADVLARQRGTGLIGSLGG